MGRSSPKGGERKATNNLKPRSTAHHVLVQLQFRSTVRTQSRPLRCRTATHHCRRRCRYSPANDEPKHLQTARDRWYSRPYRSTGYDRNIGGPESLPHLDVKRLCFAGDVDSQVRVSWSRTMNFVSANCRRASRSSTSSFGLITGSRI